MIRVSGEAPSVRRAQLNLVLTVRPRTLQVLGLMLNPIDVMVHMQKSEGGTGALWWSDFLAFPRGVTAHLDCYRELMEGTLPLSASERHLLAREASRATGCALNTQHHEEVLGEADDLTPEKRALLIEFAACVSSTPANTKNFGDKFAQAGYSDSQFQHAVFVAAYANFTSRCSLAMDPECQESVDEAGAAATAEDAVTVADTEDGDDDASSSEQ